MSAILNTLNAHNFPIFQPILMKLVSKFMVLRALFYVLIIRVAVRFNMKKFTIVYMLKLALCELRLI